MDSQIEKTWNMSWKLGLCTGPPTQNRPARIGLGSSLHQISVWELFRALWVGFVHHGTE